MIVAAAIKIHHLIMTMPQPARHHDILRQWFGVREAALGGAEANYVQETQGFIDDKGVFLTRKEAMQHAIDCGQGLPRRDSLRAEGVSVYEGKDLFSEDLW